MNKRKIVVISIVTVIVIIIVIGTVKLLFYGMEVQREYM